MTIDIKNIVKEELDKAQALDAEAREKTIEMQKAAIDIEKQRISKHTENYAMTEDEMMRLEGVEEELADAKKARRKAKLLCGVIFALCIVCFIARFVA